jgi:S-adenosylmethionine synthetase
MQIFTEKITKPVDRQEVEFVESKGIGHPDTICDDVCELCGKALADYYRKNFNTVFHYNIDKALLVAGTAAPRFRAGKITRPIKLIIAGRVTDRIGKRTLPIKRLIKDTASNYLKRFSRARFTITVDVQSAAANLAVVSGHKDSIANDTSFGASHFPFSKTEQLVLDARNYLNSAQLRKRFPAIGQDIKVMGIRTKKSIEFTAAIAFIGKHVKDMEHYIKIKNSISEHLTKRFKAVFDINKLDDVTGDENSIYLTATGLSAEMGDDGQVGRANRYNNLITPGRPMAIEAYSGKNSRHPGRCYQIASFNIAKDLVLKHRAGSAEVKLVTHIGSPLDDPKVVSIKYTGALKKKGIEKTVKKAIRKTISS